MRRTLLALALGLAGCAAETVDATHADEDLGHDAPWVLEARTDIETELATSPTHVAEAPFARISVLYRSPAPLAVQIATSNDGLVWSDYVPGTVSDEASDAEWGVWVVDLDVADGEALYWRVRGAGDDLPTELAADTMTIDELAALAEGADDGDGSITGTDELGVTAEYATTFRRYRFDLGYVGRAFLWMLRTARRRGWGGTLYGPRTGLRTYAQQASLWNAYQNGTGAPAFPPWGPSRHLIRNVRRVGTWYQAIDTNDVGDLIRIARGMGVSLHTPYSREPWHVEARRAFGAPRGWRP
jgi:hypothetical protein